MIEVVYQMSSLETSMFISESCRLYSSEGVWLRGDQLRAGDQLVSCCGSIAEVIEVNAVNDRLEISDLKQVHNHRYFVSAEQKNHEGGAVNEVGLDPLEQVAYELANKPSTSANGEPTGHHAGPWVAAEYLNADIDNRVVTYGCASEAMCAEDAAVNALRQKLGNKIELNQCNVKISHAYIRKYTKKGRMINTMSPCLHCRKNYGAALSDATVGESSLVKTGRGRLPNK